jgi:predicted HD phosphohydrolase
MVLEDRFASSVIHDTVASDILLLYSQRRLAAFFGETVSPLQHALQCAYLALRADASDSMVAATLLHDIGYQLLESRDRRLDWGIKDCHEELGALWLERHFDLAVTEPIRLHGTAKRYLAATEPNYLQGLSEPSRVRLLLQGGAFSRREAKQFESLPYFDDAIQLRRWDDEAKQAGLRVPSLSAYLPLLHSLARK